MTGTESTKIPPHGENVFHWERTEIEEAFTPLNPKDAHDAAMKYSNVATQWDQGLETFARSVQASIAESWEGSAADKAKDAITRYVKDAHELTPLITQMSNDMEAAADAIRTVANGIPEANHHSWTANVWPPRASEEEKTRSEATAGARNAMLENYVKKFAEFDGRVPVLPTALNPTNPLDISGPTVPGDNGPGTPGGSGNPNSPGKSGNPTDTGDENPDEKKSEEKSTEEQPTSQDTNPSSTNPTSTDPSSTPTTPTTPTALDPSKSGTPTTPAGTPGGHPGSPGGSGTPSGSPSPGRSVPGVPGTPTGANPAAAAAARLAGSSGMPGMGGMGAGAGRGKSDDENTHQTPDYLINEANTAELIGEIARTVPGGVIGADPAPPPPPRS
ncbi:WXG100 family type VII secretion target [Nocardia sp. NPDC051463]|uniref:WXG100 family type VII secretion target n=1 Tax=Nocardia sp. NPDC051463 TaxID=3154845 RepID=UPI00344B2A5B